MVRMWSSPCRRDGEVEKTPSLMGKSDANERNENSLSNCRVQLTLSTKRDGVILGERYCNEEQNKIKHHRIPHNSKICVISEIRVPLIPQTAQV